MVEERTKFDPPLTTNASNVAAIIQRVERIRELAVNHKGPLCHQEQDELFSDLLKAIADGDCSDSRACAAAALETLKISFDRWYE